jgi:hypothetical protein
VWAEQPREHAQQGRLARAVAAEHRQRLPLLQAQAHAGERHALAVAPLKVLELDRRFHQGGSLWRPE